MTATFRKHASQAGVIELTRKLCELNSIAFSVNDANLSIADTLSDQAVDDFQMLDAVGQRVGIRFREAEGTFRNLEHSAMEAGPVVVRCDTPGHESGCSYVIVIRKKSPAKYVVFFDQEERTVKRSWLRKRANRNPGEAYRWYLAQPMFANEAASSGNYHSGIPAQPLSPIKRLQAILKPESRDIRTVFVFSIFVGILSLTTPLAVEALVNTIAFGRYMQPLIVLTIIVFVFLAFRAGLGVMMTVVVEVIQRRLFVRVVDDLALRLTRVPTAKLRKNYGPELVNRFFDVVNIQKVTSKLLLESLMLILQTVIGLTVLAFYHPFLLGYDIGLITIMVVVLYFIGRGAVKTAVSESALKYETAAWLQEIVRHPATFKFNGGAAFAINRADELAGRYIQSRRRHFQILVRQVTFSMLMQAVAATVLLGLGGYLVIEGQMTLGQLVAAELIVTVILGSFAKIGNDLESFYDLLASVDKLGKLLDLPAGAADKLRLAPHNGPAAIKLVEVKSGAGPGQGLDINIAPGTTLALFGCSGSGKTTVLEAIAGLHPPVGGHVLVNGFRVDLISAESLQSRIGFVNDIEIFEGSVDENLRLGRHEIDSESMNDIIEKMGLHKTITGLEYGMQTGLSVSGYPLSTGQAIRLVLARALIARPGALLIDGLLDRLSDDDLQDVLARLGFFSGSTTIVIATGRRGIADWADQKVELVN